MRRGIVQAGAGNGDEFGVHFIVERNGGKSTIVAHHYHHTTQSIILIGGAISHKIVKL